MGVTYKSNHECYRHTGATRVFIHTSVTHEMLISRKKHEKEETPIPIDTLKIHVSKHFGAGEPQAYTQPPQPPRHAPPHLVLLGNRNRFGRDRGQNTPTPPFTLPNKDQIEKLVSQNLKRMKVDSAAGVDGITGLFMKNARFKVSDNRQTHILRPIYCVLFEK